MGIPRKIGYGIWGIVLSSFFIFQGGCSTVSPQKTTKGTQEVETPPSLSALEKKKEELATLERLYDEGTVALGKRDHEKAIDLFLEILSLKNHYRDSQEKLIEAYQIKEDYLKRKGVQKEEADWGKEYRVNQGDILDISVWQWPDLRSPEVYVRPDGKISFPLVGDVEAVGRTLTEIDRELTEKLTEYIKSPEVSVSIRRFGGKKVIVLGEVRSPGVYAPTGRSTVLEVIALAGGFSTTAVTTNVMVIRGDLVKSEAIVCDLRRAIKQGDLSQNIIAEPNDIIFVPKRFISKVSELAGELGTQLSTVLAGVEVARDFNIHKAGN